MSSLLPVLQENHPAMSLCAICPKPGHCCTHFGLWHNGQELSFWASCAESSARKFLGDSGLPFEVERVKTWHNTRRGWIYCTFFYFCPKLDSNGRCSIYDSRPAACKMFVPGSDEICVFAVKRPGEVNLYGPRTPV